MANLAQASEKASWRFLCCHCLDTLSQPPTHPVMTISRLDVASNFIKLHYVGVSKDIDAYLEALMDDSTGVL